MTLDLTSSACLGISWVSLWTFERAAMCRALLAGGVRVTAVTGFSLKNARRMRGEREDELLAGPCPPPGLALVIAVTTDAPWVLTGVPALPGEVSPVGAGTKRTVTLGATLVMLRLAVPEQVCISLGGGFETAPTKFKCVSKNGMEVKARLDASSRFLPLHT